MLVKIEIDVYFKVHKIKSMNIQPRLLSYYRASSKINSTFQNHGIPEEKINGIYSFAKRLFDLPEEQKMKFYMNLTMSSQVQPNGVPIQNKSM